MGLIGLMGLIGFIKLTSPISPISPMSPIHDAHENFPRREQLVQRRIVRTNSRAEASPGSAHDRRHCGDFHRARSRSCAFRQGDASRDYRLPYLVLVLADWGVQITPDQAAKVTFEYGNTFLCVAGALNMLAAMDAYDIGIGRKA